MSRKYPGAPIVGVGAVVVDDRGRVALIKRGQEPLKGWWSLPGGAVELGETARQAVAREVQEETGLMVEVGDVVDVVDHVTTDDDGRVQYHFVIIDYVCRVTSGALRAAGDADDAAWADPAVLGQYSLTEKTLSVISRALPATARRDIL